MSLEINYKIGNYLQSKTQQRCMELWTEHNMEHGTKLERNLGQEQNMEHGTKLERNMELEQN